MQNNKDFSLYYFIMLNYRYCTLGKVSKLVSYLKEFGVHLNPGYCLCHHKLRINQ